MKKIIAMILSLVMLCSIVFSNGFAVSAVSFDEDIMTVSEQDGLEYNGNRYKVIDISMTWEDAKLYCEDLGGHLATVTSQEEQSIIEQLANVSNKDHLWIGAKRNSNNEFEWITEENFEFSNWSYGEPNNYHNSEDWLMLYTGNSGFENGKWNDTLNDGDPIEKWGFVCEWEDESDDDNIMNSNWTQLYSEYIIQDKIKNGEYSGTIDPWEFVEYELIYVDDDNVPELSINYNVYASGRRLVFYLNNTIYSHLIGAGTLKYAEYKNLLYHMGGIQGVYSDTSYKIVDGDLIEVDRGSYNTYDYTYKWNGELVSKTEYGSKVDGIKMLTTKETGSTNSKVYDYEVILEYLNSMSNSGSNEDIVDGIKVYSDYTNLSVKKDSTIKVGVSVFVDGVQSADLSGVTFLVENNSKMKVINTKEVDNCYFVTLKGLETGTSYITFSNSDTGDTIKIPITIYDHNYNSFTLNSVPEQNIEKYTSNIYNVNGIYIDSYDYTLNDDKSATVTFDVYNTNYIYGVVEVYDADGNMDDAVVIEKMTGSNTSIKESVWDNSCCLVRDIWDGDLLTYRQESGYSKKTSVSVKIPKGGYIKVTTDTSSSFLAGLINGVDILMGIKSVAGDIAGYDVNSKEFTGTLTKKIVKEAAFAEFVKDSDKYAKKLYKNIGKELLVSEESMGSFADTFLNNLSELSLESVIFDTAKSFGWSTAESLFMYFSGPVGTVMKGMFAFAEVSNLVIQADHFVAASGCKAICKIENQGGGTRAAAQITIKSETNISDDTALSVFKIYPDSQYLDLLKKAEPELYEQFRSQYSETYNITMVKNGAETQPEDEIKVFVPIPDELKALAYLGMIKVYRMEDDGTMTEMDTEIQDGCLVFTTDHFSIYTVMGMGDSTGNYISDVLDYEYETFMDGTILITRYIGSDSKVSVPTVIDGYVVKYMYGSAFDNCDSAVDTMTSDRINIIDGLGDVNLDGKLNIKDATAIQKYLASLIEFSEIAEKLANYDGDNRVTIKDATAIQKKLAGLT